MFSAFVSKIPEPQLPLSNQALRAITDACKRLIFNELEDKDLTAATLLNAKAVVIENLRTEIKVPISLHKYFITYSKEVVIQKCIMWVEVYQPRNIPIAYLGKRKHPCIEFAPDYFLKSSKVMSNDGLNSSAPQNPEKNKEITFVTEDPQNYPELNMLRVEHPSSVRLQRNSSVRQAVPALRVEEFNPTSNLPHANSEEVCYVDEVLVNKTVVKSSDELTCLTERPQADEAAKTQARSLCGKHLYNLLLEFKNNSNQIEKNVFLQKIKEKFEADLKIVMANPSNPLLIRQTKSGVLPTSTHIPNAIVEMFKKYEPTHLLSVMLGAIDNYKKKKNKKGQPTNLTDELPTIEEELDKGSIEVHPEFDLKPNPLLLTEFPEAEEFKSNPDLNWLDLDNTEIEDYSKQHSFDPNRPELSPQRTFSVFPPPLLTTPNTTSQNNWNEFDVVNLKR